MHLRHSQVRFAEGETASSVIPLASDRLVGVVVPEGIGPQWAFRIETRHTDVVNTTEVPWEPVTFGVPGDRGWQPIERDLVLMDTRFVRDEPGPAFDLGLVLAPRS